MKFKLSLVSIAQDTQMSESVIVILSVHLAEIL